MDAAQWPKDIVRNNDNLVQDKKAKPQHEQPLKCPRCNSTNTKFCYYNNYSLTQPRYFCKACKRYWTKGGSLRSVPVGGGSRKNKRSVSSTPSMISKPIHLPQFSSQGFTTHEAQDLNLASQQEYHHHHHHHGFSQFLKLPKIENRNVSFLSSESNAMFNLQDFKPPMGFPFQGNGIKYGNFQEGNEGIIFPFGQHSSRDQNGQSMGDGNSSGYWNGTLGGGSSTLYN